MARAREGDRRRRPDLLDDAAKPTKIGEVAGRRVNDPATTMEERIKSAFGLEKMVKCQRAPSRGRRPEPVATRGRSGISGVSALLPCQHALGVAPVAAGG